jgi:phenylalanyl-tRNA synthetase beta chain
MKFSYNWLQEYFSKNLPKPEKLAEILTLRSFEVEGVQKIGKDYIFDIDVLPNRMPDASGHLGIASECAAILNLKLKAQNSKLQSKTQSSKNKFLEIKVEDFNLCPRYTALVMRDVEVRPSPKWLKERLEILGVNSINNVVDAANYVMLETGQPLHIFDLDKLENERPQLKTKNLRKRIVVRRAKNGEKITTLDNKEYNLDNSILVIADSENPLAIAGIKGGKKAEVGLKTKNIILESANFNAPNIRKTSQNLNLRTDASIRFSYGLDPNLTEKAINNLAELIQKIAGGEIANSVSDAYQKKTVSARIKLDFEKARKILGVNISDKEIKGILQRLSFSLKDSGAALRVEIPTIRRDLQIEEDLIEEIARLYGYENIKLSHPLGELIPPARNDRVFWSKKARFSLKETGFSEVYNYSFVGQKEADIMPSKTRTSLVEIENPLRPEFKFMRPALIFGLLANVSLNLKNYSLVKIFEIGNVFKYADKRFYDTSQLEKTHLAFIHYELQSQEIFFQLKGILTSFFESLGVGGIWFDDSPSSPAEFHDVLRILTDPSRSAQIKIENDVLGVIGEFHPEIKKNFGIKGKIGFVELNFDEVIKTAEEEQEFRPISKYPAVFRDISILVPRKTKVIEITDIIENVAGELLIDSDLFDIYEAENISGGKKSLAFRLTFQSHEKTLSDDEVNKIMDRIIKSLEEKPNWEVRR